MAEQLETVKMSYKTVPCEAKMIRLRACEGVFETTKHLVVDQVPLKVNFTLPSKHFEIVFGSIFRDFRDKNGID